MEYKTFDTLWEAAENFHKDAAPQTTIQELIIELTLKLNLYKALDLKKEIPQEELMQMKARTIGEILLTISNISLIDNINIFTALKNALQYQSIELYSQKYKD